MFDIRVSPRLRAAAQSLNLSVGRQMAVALVMTCLTLLLVQPAFAAPTGRLSLSQFSNIIFVRGDGFPASSIVTGTVSLNGASGSTSLRSNNRGQFITAFGLPANANGVLVAQFRSGSVTATSRLSVGKGTAVPPTTSAPTTAPKPTTSTTAKPGVPAPTTTVPAPTTTAPKPTTTVPAPTTTAAPTTTTTAPLSNVPGPVGGPGGNWRAVFNEDFNGNSVDRNVWPVCHWATKPGCTGQNAGELQQWKPENVVVGGGKASLVARKQPSYIPQLNTTMPYTSGMISTGPWDTTPNHKPTFDFRYGYVESRIKVAPGKGMWSSFWLEPRSLQWPPEIDIVEAPNFEDNKVLNNFHYGTPKDHKGSGRWTTGPNWSAGYHTFAVDWTPSSITWYIDGQPTHSVNNPAIVPQVNMYIIANLSVGGWAGAPPASTGFPNSMDIDYIRVWQR